MLKTIEEVCAYTEQEDPGLPDLYGRAVLRRIEGGGKISSEFRRSYSLPDKYYSLVNEYDFFRLSIGYFNLWPGSLTDSNLVESIEFNNSNNNNFFSYIKSHNLINVAGEEMNQICVGESSSKVPDFVYYIDLATSPTPTMHLIASDFEKFVILAANLHQISLNREGDDSAATADIDEVCEHLGLDGTQREFWERKVLMLVS